VGATLVDGRLLAKRRGLAYIVVSAPSRNGHRMHGGRV
jgi:hypothetical protein